MVAMFAFSLFRTFTKVVLPALLLMSMLQACEQDESAPFEPIEYEKLSGVLFSKTLNLEKLSTEVLKEFGAESIESVLREQGIPESEARSIASKMKLYIKLVGDYEVHGITYHTVSPQGEPIVASGVLYYPKSRKPKGVLEVMSWFKSKGECGTVNQHQGEALSGIEGYVCIIADQVGYGSTADRHIDYLNYENVAVVSADMRRAAEEFVYNHYRRKLDENTSIFGYSLGAGGALSLARYYHRHPERGVKVKEVFVGGGAYETSLILEKQFESYYADPVVLPNVICSWNHYENLQLDFSKIFKGKLLENYTHWCYGQLSLPELKKRLGTDLRAYFTEEFLKQEHTHEIQQLMQASQRRKVTIDWRPDCKIYLFHGENDICVPIAASDRIYEELLNVGAEVVYKKYEADHMDAVKFMIVDLWKHLSSF